MDRDMTNPALPREGALDEALVDRMARALSDAWQIHRPHGINLFPTSIMARNLAKAALSALPPSPTPPRERALDENAFEAGIKAWQQTFNDYPHCGSYFRVRAAIRAYLDALPSTPAAGDPFGYGWPTHRGGEIAFSKTCPGDFAFPLYASPPSPAPSSDVWTDEECREAEQTIDDLNEALRFANRRIVELERRAALAPSPAPKEKP